MLLTNKEVYDRIIRLTSRERSRYTLKKGQKKIKKSLDKFEKKWYTVKAVRPRGSVATGP